MVQKHVTHFNKRGIMSHDDTNTPQQQSTHIDLELIAANRYPKRRGRPKTAKGYLKLFIGVGQAYTSCENYIALYSYSMLSNSLVAPSMMVAAIHYKVDVELAARRVLRTPSLWSAFCNLLRCYWGLGDYDPVLNDVERSIVVAVGHEWEYRSLHKPIEYFADGVLRYQVDGVDDLSEKPLRRKVRHGHSRRGRTTPEYRAWQAMKARCNNPNSKGYEYYGGRGIKVAAPFLVFEVFLAEVGFRPGPEYSLDRIDNDGDYAPGNVRWALKTGQNRNRRRSSEWPSNKRKAAVRFAATGHLLEVVI
jgi:hypothetical protein